MRVVSVLILEQGKDITEGVADLLFPVDTASTVVGVVQTEVALMQMSALWEERNTELLREEFPPTCEQIQNKLPSKYPG